MGQRINADRLRRGDRIRLLEIRSRNTEDIPIGQTGVVEEEMDSYGSLAIDWGGRAGVLPIHPEEGDEFELI